ncbi:MAG: isoprenylcysteine carboxylmethyltransferase family protein [Fuerstiella sp.]
MQQFFAVQLGEIVPAQTIVSWVLIISGIGLMNWGLFTFRRARTAIYPNQPARQLVANGPYRFSRNPMYVGLAMMTVGIGLLADNIWMLIFLPITLTVLWKLVIQKEEQYLRSEFGSVYEKYQQQVRRWI